jgi:excisionase family DNA binding protein
VAELADWLKIPVNTVYWLNTNGQGPRYARFGRAVRYRRRDVETWIAAKYADQAAR